MIESKVKAEPRALDLESLIEHRAAISSAATVEAAYEQFCAVDADFMAVIDGERLTGVCTRREIGQLLGSRYGFALHARQPVANYLTAEPLQAASDMPITEIFKAAAARERREFYDDIVLTDESGRYLGMIPVRTVVRLQTEYLLGNISALESSRREIANKNRQIESDLQMAREVQLAMLPQLRAPSDSDVDSLRMAHRYLPAGGLSGDFFDVIRLSDHRIGVLVCDVMGHGVRSALITVMVRAMLEQFRKVAADPGRLLTEINRDLSRTLRQTGELIFVTAAYAVYDFGAGSVFYAQAGHPTPLRWEAALGTGRRISCPPEAEGPALGLIDNFSYVSVSEALVPGDRWLFFTDGIFEATAANGEEFGLERLGSALALQAGKPLDGALAGMLELMTAFCDREAPADDICLVAVECGRLGEKTAPNQGGQGVPSDR